jgi:O-antigen/teichoic acid export membrane protein
MSRSTSGVPDGRSECSLEHRASESPALAVAMAEPVLSRGSSEQAAVRVAANTSLRVVGDILGKIASLVLFAAIARGRGEDGLGVFVLAFSFGQLVVIPVDFGLDRYVLRQVASSPDRAGELFAGVTSFKAVLAPILGLGGIGLMALLGYERETVLTLALLMPGLMLDSFTRTVGHVLMGLERQGRMALVTVTQRVTGAALGLLVLSQGGQVEAVAACYSAGTAAGFLLSLALLHRVHPLRGLRRRFRGWRQLTRASFPFGVQDVFSVMLFRLDAILISLLATQVAVGRYGAAYRMFEASLFIAYGVAGSFAAMYTYLGPDTQPTIQTAFARSLKLALVALAPLAVALAMLSEPLMRALFGPDFADAADTLRLLAPLVILVGLVTLISSLMVSRKHPRPMIRLTAAMVALNVALNLVLVPRLQENGAAIAIGVTELVFLALGLRLALKTVGAIRAREVLAGPIVAAATMALVIWAVTFPWPLAAATGAVVYLLVLGAVESVVCPTDVAFLRRLVADRVGALRAR